LRGEREVSQILTDSRHTSTNRGGGVEKELGLQQRLVVRKERKDSRKDVRMKKKKGKKIAMGATADKTGRNIYSAAGKLRAAMPRRGGEEVVIEKTPGVMWRRSRSPWEERQVGG